MIEGGHTIQGRTSFNLGQSSSGADNNSLSVSASGSKNIRKLSYNGALGYSLSNSQSDFRGISLLDQLERRRSLGQDPEDAPTDITTHTQNLSLRMGYRFRRNITFISSIDGTNQKTVQSNDEPESVGISVRLTNRVAYRVHSTLTVTTSIETARSNFYQAGDRISTSDTIALNQVISVSYGEYDSFSIGAAYLTGKTIAEEEVIASRLDFNYTWTHRFRHGEFTSGFSQRESESRQDEAVIRDLTSRLSNSFSLGYTHNVTANSSVVFNVTNQRLDPVEGIDATPSVQRVYRVSAQNGVNLSRLSSLNLAGAFSSEELEAEERQLRTRVSLSATLTF